MFLLPTNSTPVTSISSTLTTLTYLSSLLPSPHYVSNMSFVPALVAPSPYVLTGPPYPSLKTNSSDVPSGYVANQVLTGLITAEGHQAKTWVP